MSQLNSPSSTGPIQPSAVVPPPLQVSPLATSGSTSTSTYPAGNPSVSGPLVQSRQQVHGEGLFFSLQPEDYLKNLTAIKSLLNEKNGLQKQVDEFDDPSGVRIATSIGAVVNIFALTFVGIGTNLVTGENPPPWSYVIFGMGVVLSLVATVGPALVAFFPAIFKKVKV